MEQRELDLGATYRLTGERRELLRGGVDFASAEEQSQRCTELLGGGALLVTLPAPNADARGRLGDVLEELVERELARMGAPSPYLAAWCAMPEDAQARLADQLFRARTVGATGLVIAMGSLRAIAQPELTTDDSATLRWLAETTSEAPLFLLVDDADLHLLGHRAPVSLALLLTEHRRANRTLDSEIQLRVSTMTAPPSDVPIAWAAKTDEVEAAHTDAAPPVALAVALEADVAAESAIEVEVEVDDAPIEVAPAVEVPPVAPTSAEPIAHVAPPPLPSRRTAARSGRAHAGIPESGPNDAWRTWAIALSSTRGAQPLAALERLFAENYVPLSHAIATGLDDPRALRAHEDFQRSFERSYTDAFITFGATNRRPRLVMDAYDLASKQARLGSARSSHVLVVDSMRYDLGCLVRDALVRETAGVATLTSETILWSALPTTTIRQIETFARGLDALREPPREEPSDSLRGRAAEVVRRMRIGSRELYKLDLVASMLEGATNVAASLESIANTAAEALARHISTLPPRTLLFVVGDHGFTVDRRGEVTTGGASPEEVLVPAMSFLVGDLH